LYSDKVIEHFQSPRNMGEIEGADAIGKVGNPVCGDMMWISIKVEADHEGREILSDIRFKTFGCVAAIATSSMVTELAKGKTLDEALTLTRQDVSNALGTLPPVKEHCSNLAAEGLHKAIREYLRSKGRITDEEMPEEHSHCHCN